MIDIRTYIRESIFDDEESQFDDIDRTVSGFNDAMKGLNIIGKHIRRSNIAGILRNLKNTEKFGIVYRKARNKSFEDAEMVFLKVIKLLMGEDINMVNVFKYFHKILYKYFEDMYEYKTIDTKIGFGPHLKKGFNKHVEEELVEQGYTNYKNAVIWLAWSDWTAPSSKYMLKTLKDMDKDETEFMIKFMKIIENN